jgi:transposase
LKRLQKWKVSDDFWSRVKPLIPERQRDASRSFKRKAGGGRKPQDPRKVFDGIIFVMRTGSNGKPCLTATMAVPAPFISISWHGRQPVYLNSYGMPA